MNFRLATYLALRLVRSRRAKTLSLVTAISIVGMAVGVWALIVVMGVTSGFQQSFQERILGLYPHLVVHKRGTEFKEYPDLLPILRETPGVIGASPVTYDDMMISAGVHRSGVMVKGVDLATVRSVVNVEKLLGADTDISDLSEAPTRFRLSEAGGLEIRGLVAGTRNTAILDGDSLSHRFDDGAMPRAGHAKVSVIDLRKAPHRGGRLVMERKQQGALDKHGEQDERPHSKDGMRRNRPETLPTHLELSPTQTVELPAGDYVLAPHSERVALDADTIVTCVLRPDGAVSWLVEKVRIPLRERQALLRVVSSASSTPPVQVEDLPVVATKGAYVAVEARLPGVILGVSLAERLDAVKGDEVSLVTPLRGVDSAMLGPFGMEPSSTRHKVVGTFESGFHDYDVRLALTNIRAAQRFLNRGSDIRWIEVKTEDLVAIDDTKRRVATALDPYDMETVTRNGLKVHDHLQRLVAGDFPNAELAPAAGFIDSLRSTMRVMGVLKFQEYDLGYAPRYRLVDWKEMNANLFGALTLQKVVLALFFSIMIIVGAFVVVGSQLMIIHDKAPDIAILKAMGAPRSLVRLTFTVQGVMVAAVGCLVGIVNGVLTCQLIAWFDYELEASIYLIDRLPATVEWGVVGLVTLGALMTTMLATQYSAGRAAAKTPVEGLRAID